MKKTTLILVTVILLVVFIILLLLAANNSNKSNQTTKPEIIVSMPSIPQEVTQSSTQPGEYLSYSESALSSEKKNLLFFAASWCPSCKQLDENIKSNLNSIPSDLNILKVDFDSATDLKRKYGVTIQHTLVQVDAEGNLLKKWNGLYNQYSIEDLVSELI